MNASDAAQRPWQSHKMIFARLLRFARNDMFRFFALALVLLLTPTAAQADYDAAKSLPIQHKGRVKSFDAFSKQTLQLISGKETWHKLPAHEVLLGAYSARDSVMTWPWIRIDLQELTDLLELKPDQKYYSYDDITPQFTKVLALARSAKAKRDADERPVLIEQKCETLFSQYITVQQIISGENLTVIPSTIANHPWFSPFSEGQANDGFFQNLLRAYHDKDQAVWDKDIKSWIQFIQPIVGSRVLGKMKMEVFYYDIKPFHSAWIAYFLAFIFLVIFKKIPWLKKLGFLAFAAGLGFHTWGLILRIIVLERPPVSNMFESMVFMNWALIVAAIVFSLIKKSSLPIVAGCAVSAVVMIFADLLPIDSSMDVLVPVLRSNYWLTIHVLTIVSSYGLFGLAMGLGHRHVWVDIHHQFTPETEKASGLLLLRIIELGVIFIGVGTVLGGVWANESWGRFWGWDPKETWALITFLGYLIVVHLRYLKRIGDFALAMSSILGFLLVLFTWYGVNFVLGRGLHSYGQGSGGMQWILYYLFFEALFLGFVVVKKLRR